MERRHRKTKEIVSMELSWVYVKVKGEVWKESRAIAQQRHQVTMLDLPNDFHLCHKLNCRPNLRRGCCREGIAQSCRL